MLLGAFSRAAAAVETHKLADCTIQSMDYLRTQKMQRRSAVDGHGSAAARRIAEQLYSGLSISCEYFFFFAELLFRFVCFGWHEFSM